MRSDSGKSAFISRLVKGLGCCCSSGSYSLFFLISLTSQLMSQLTRCFRFFFFISRFFFFFFSLILSTPSADVTVYEARVSGTWPSRRKIFAASPLILVRLHGSEKTGRVFSVIDADEAYRVLFTRYSVLTTPSGQGVFRLSRVSVLSPYKYFPTVLYSFRYRPQDILSPVLPSE